MRRMLYLLFPFFLLFSRCGNGTPGLPAEETRFLMDTVVRIAVYDPHRAEDRVRRAMDAAFDTMASIESRVSRYAEGSDISRINRTSAGETAVVSSVTNTLLEQAIRIARETGGHFDPAAGALKRLWGFDTDHPAVPDSESVRSTLDMGGYESIRLTPQGVIRMRPGVEVDLGAMAKGYTVDAAVEVLKRAGIKAGLVDAGGDMRLFGKRPGRDHWAIGIRHPRQGMAGLFGVLHTGPAAIATSGDYERFFMKDGKRWHHILDPGTGYPARPCISVTIVAPDALLADAFATAVFVMGPHDGMRFIESREDIEGLILYEQDGRILKSVSRGLAGQIELRDAGGQ